MAREAPGVPRWAPLCVTLALSLLALALPRALPAQAAEDAPLVGDRPDFTESALAVTRLQLEAGYTFEDQAGTGVHTAGELLLRIPAARRLEVRVGVPSWTAERPETPGASGPEGFGDASLGIKLGLRDPASSGGGPAVALLAGTSLPTGEVGSETADPEGVLAVDVGLSDRLSLGTNVGVAADGEGEERHARFSASAALGLDLVGGLGAYLEAFGFAPTGDGPASSSVVNGGVTWLAGPGLQLDVRLGTGLSGPSPDVIFGTGVVWRP